MICLFRISWVGLKSFSVSEVWFLWLFSDDILKACCILKAAELDSDAQACPDGND